MHFSAQPRPAIAALSASRIREVANAAMGLPDVLAFWFGEPDRPTPGFISDAAKRALDQGRTFYSPNLGLPELRSALADYVGKLHPEAAITPSRIAVTSSGVSALMLAAQALLSPGDRVVAVVPLWPNLSAIAQVLGAQVETVDLQVDPQSGRWRLDVQALLAALTGNTRMLILNSPGNPTGWVMPRAAMAEVIAHCRQHGIWILSDEAYERLIFDGSPCAPSMLDVAHPQDRLVVANTFSKTWQMTGWRLGWLVLPETLVPAIEKLIEFNSSCAPEFIQIAGITAIEQGDQATRDFVESVRAGATHLMTLLRELGPVRAVEPEGAMYVLLRIEGQPDSLTLAKDLVVRARLGLAPGIAFGGASEGYLRWCVARPPAVLSEGVERLRAYLNSRPGGA
jgi:aspartate/methionine/tyrosine aminotransferase